MPDEALVTNDAAVHRAYHVVEPFMLDPTDEELMAGKVVMTVEQMLQHVAQEMAEHPEKHPPPPGQTREGFGGELGRLAKLAPEQFELYKAGLDQAFSDMPALATMVYELRVGHGASWRHVAQVMSAAVNFPGPQNSQVVGMALCALAAEAQDQDFMLPPWNVYPETQKAPASIPPKKDEAGAEA